MFLHPHHELTLEQRSQWLQNKTNSPVWHAASVPSKVSIPIFSCSKWIRKYGPKSWGLALVQHKQKWPGSRVKPAWLCILFYQISLGRSGWLGFVNMYFWQLCSHLGNLSAPARAGGDAEKLCSSGTVRKFALLRIWAVFSTLWGTIYG